MLVDWDNWFFSSCYIGCINNGKTLKLFFKIDFSFSVKISKIRWKGNKTDFCMQGCEKFLLYCENLYSSIDISAGKNHRMKEYKD